MAVSTTLEFEVFLRTVFLAPAPALEPVAMPFLKEELLVTRITFGAFVLVVVCFVLVAVFLRQIVHVHFGFTASTSVGGSFSVRFARILPPASVVSRKGESFDGYHCRIS